MYKLEKPDLADNTVKVVQRISDNTFIPFDPANTDYQQYLAWLDGYEMVNGKLEKTSDSNTPLPAE